MPVSRDDILYWNPVPHIDAVFRSFPQDGLWCSRATVFRGKWEERNRFNVPGPFYGATTDNCWVGRLHAPRHILYGDDTDYELEFLYRQPRTPDELHSVIIGMHEDPFNGWACDGDAHWTPNLVREWWRDRSRLRQWITSKYPIWNESQEALDREAATGFMDYLAYLDTDLTDHLRAYMYFLDHGTSPIAANTLPSL
jgi:hypothetical protein